MAKALPYDAKLRCGKCGTKYTTKRGDKGEICGVKPIHRRNVRDYIFIMSCVKEGCSGKMFSERRR